MKRFSTPPGAIAAAVILILGAAVVSYAIDSASVASTPPAAINLFGLYISREISMGSVITNIAVCLGLLWQIVRKLRQYLGAIPEMHEQIKSHIEDDRRVWDEMRRAIGHLTELDQQQSAALIEHRIAGEAHRRALKEQVSRLEQDLLRR